MAQSQCAPDRHPTKTRIFSEEQAMPDKLDKLLLINGPNLNMLGRRDPKIYGEFTLADAEALARRTAASRGFALDCYQSNHEGDLVDRIQQAIGSYAGVMINAGALTHYSYALRDALELLPVPVIEVHISDISQREDFRRLSVIRPVCGALVAGYGLDSYRIAVEEICRLIKGSCL
jgi:3-dehydroquinate dehydratase type II